MTLSRDAVIRPPLKVKGCSFKAYLRTIIKHEANTRKSCDRFIQHLIDIGGTPPDVGEWEKYFFNLRIGAALMFLAECGDNDEEGEESGIIVKLPKDNAEAMRLLLCDLWDKHFCLPTMRLDALSKYFPGSDSL